MATSYSSREWSRSEKLVPRVRSLGSRMTRHVAAAVMLFAAIQIWLVNAALDLGAPRTISIVALMVLMGLAIPFARRTERRWQRYGEDALPCHALTLRFRSEVRRIWMLALLVPTIWVGAVTVAGTAIAAI